jgi:hypothetical protein
MATVLSGLVNVENMDQIVTVGKKEVAVRRI